MIKHICFVECHEFKCYIVLFSVWKTNAYFIYVHLLIFFQRPTGRWNGYVFKAGLQERSVEKW